MDFPTSWPPHCTLHPGGPEHEAVWLGAKAIMSCPDGPGARGWLTRLAVICALPGAIVASPNTTAVASRLEMLEARLAKVESENANLRAELTEQVARDMSFLESPSSIACNGYPDGYQRPHLQQYHRYESCRANYHRVWPRLLTGTASAQGPPWAIGSPQLHTMVDTRSTLLIDDGIIGMQSDS